MKKREFIKLLKNKYDGAKKYNKLTIILSILFIFYTIFVLYIQNLGIIPNMLILIIHVIHLCLMIPVIIFDLKNDFQINKLFKQYKNENKIFEYKDYSEKLKKILILETIFVLISGTIIFTKCLSKHFEKNNSIEVTNKNNENNETVQEFEIETNKGNIIKLTKKEFDGFYIYLPSDFEILDEEILKIKYPSENRPSLAYSNEDASINIVFNLEDNSLSNNQINEYISSLEEIFNKITEDLETNIIIKDNHNIGELSFVTNAIDTKIYNHMIAFSINGELRLISFNCIDNYKEEWKMVSNFILNSLKFE